MSKNYIQIIFCVETNKKAKTDESYLKEILRYFCFVGNNKISFVYMDGKYNYNSETVQERIKDLIDAYGGSGRSEVVYVHDKDSNYSNSDDNKFVEDVEKYCSDNGYHLVWFVKDIEEVMLGNNVNQNDKRQEALKYARSNKIKTIDKNKLSALQNVNKSGNSNILTVLNKFPEIKK